MPNGDTIMKYQLAIFDLDGTLLNTLDDLADAANHVLADAGFPVRTTDEVRRFVGNGYRKLIERRTRRNGRREDKRGPLRLPVVLCESLRRQNRAVPRRARNA